MRVCVVTLAGHGVGGMQDHTRDLARGLVAAGHDVDVVTAEHPDGKKEEMRDGARWHYVPAPGRHRRVPFHHRDWLSGSYSTFQRLHAARAFDVVHSESSSAFGLIRKGVHRRVAMTVKYHGSFLGPARASIGRARAGDAGAKVRELKYLAWITARHLDRGECFRFRPLEWMVPARQQFEDTLRAEFLVRSRGHVVPNGIDVDVFKPRPKAEARSELGLPTGPLLVSVGRLSREKGMDLAIRALGLVDGAFPDARLVLVGPGDEEESLRRLAADLGLVDRVLFVGAQPRERVAAYLAAADVFLFPTLTDEAAPLVLPQAMATEAPVVASSMRAIAEVVETDGERGILVPPGDVDALARGAQDLLANPDLSRRLAVAGRQRVLAGYTTERMVERTVGVYRLARERLAAR